MSIAFFKTIKDIKKENKLYTPHDTVQLIAAMIEPFDGTLYKIKARYSIERNAA